MSELDAENDPAGFAMSAVVDAASSVPSTLPVTPLESFAVAEQAAEAAAAVPPASTLPTEDTTPSNVMASFGFTTGTTAQEVIPNFSSEAAANAAAANAEYLMLAAESGLGASPPDTSPSLEAQILAAMEPTSFPSGLAGQTPVPLLIPAAQSLFDTSLSTFEAGTPAYLPNIAPAGTTIVQALPVTPVLPTLPDPTSASITRIGPAAFTETITDPDPYIAERALQLVGDDLHH